jgi:hypothetical protein
MLRRSIFALALFLPTIALAQEQMKPDVWKPFRFFAGSWEGTSAGKPGTSTVESKFEFILNGNFLKVSGRSTYPPQEKSPKGQSYEGFVLISYDGGRKKFVLRAFDAEGFVIQYVLDHIDSDGRTFVFVTESMENLPFGFHARKTYKILNADEFTDTFELAPPGKDLETYVETRCKRRK